MSLPYYKRFPRDFFEGTIGMSFEVKCAYGLVLDMIYMRDGQLPDDARYIAGMLGCSVRKWNSILSELVEAGKLQRENGIISNLRADYLVEERRTYRDKKAENRSRPNKNSDVEKRSRSSARVKPEPEPEVSNSDELDLGDTPPEQPKRKAAPRGAARKCQIPDNWAPNTVSYAYGSKRGLTPEEMNHEADQFRNDAVAKQKRFIDWQAAFRTWLGNSAKWKAERAARSNNRPNTAGQPRSGGLVAAGLRDIGQSRSHGEPVSEGRGMGAGYVIDREAS
jgi:uncharacterized protein YdaU (DUF1376 family)